MSVPTYPFTWPTEESFKPLDEAFGTAFNEPRAWWITRAG